MPSSAPRTPARQNSTGPSPRPPNPADSPLAPADSPLAPAATPIARPVGPAPLRAPSRSTRRHLRALPALGETPVGADTGQGGRLRPSSASGTGSDDGDIPPPPAQLVQRLALYAFEALEGSRAIAQLAGWITPAVVQQLRERRAARTERRTIYRDDRRIVATPGRAHIRRPMPHVIEATVVLFAEPRSCVVAMRLEHAAGRWRATSLTVL
ncbi:hypothetical protein H490_0104465 [Leucobacter sp. UCD-THU]|uniref:Rv3235 family protein n=1 Tax=Leucobacter sp. UCD-THU TaxID=1292023 RepID=UPI00037E0971|nr:Rv3235 family protein [Leucobacter sp. UCD-THU]EYT55873.1 hypothetical protein H490_0104465 [Leucobacter sp. UCD-THU]